MNTEQLHELNPDIHVKDNVGRMINPYEEMLEGKGKNGIKHSYNNPKYDDFQAIADANIFHTDAPPGTYPGDAFEVVWNFYDEIVKVIGGEPRGWTDCTDNSPEYAEELSSKTRISFRIKRSHLPQVLTEADYNSWTEGGELKELYEYSILDKDNVYIIAPHYRLANTPAVQETEKVEEIQPVATGEVDIKRELIHRLINHEKHSVLNPSVKHYAETGKASGSLYLALRELIGEYATIYSDKQIADLKADNQRLSLALDETATLQAEVKRLNEELQAARKTIEDLEHKTETAKGLFENIIISSRAAVNVLENEETNQ